jgi:hypothetical protein
VTACPLCEDGLLWDSAPWHIASCTPCENCDGQGRIEDE